MQIIAQSQTPTTVSYIHLAYLSAAMSNHIYKGEVLPIQAFLGIALTTAVAYGTIRSKLAGPGARVRAVKIGAILVFFASLAVLLAIDLVWLGIRTNDDVVRHVIKTRQYWALREAPIAVGVEAAASTNGAAAALAAEYYSHSYGSNALEMHVKTYRYCELALANGVTNWWVRHEMTNFQEDRTTLEYALERGRLNPAERDWAKQKLVEFDREAPKERSPGAN